MIKYQVNHSVIISPKTTSLCTRCKNKCKDKYPVSECASFIREWTEQDKKDFTDLFAAIRQWHRENNPNNSVLL